MFENPPINKHKVKIWYLDNCNEPTDIDHIALGTVLEIANLYYTNGVVILDRSGPTTWIPPHRILKAEFEKI